MTAKQVQRRRGTAAQCDAMVPAEGEVIIDISNNRQRIGDGSLLGGHIVPNVYDQISQTFLTATVGGTANAITLTTEVPIVTYSNFQTFRFRATATNTNSVTFNVNGNGVITGKKLRGGSVVNLAAGDLVNGGIYQGVINGGELQIEGLTGDGIVTVSQGDLSTSTGTVTIIAYSGSDNRGATISSRASYLSNTYTTYISSVGSDSVGINLVVLPGGEYGFYPQTAKTGTSSGNLVAKQRYMLSSPPYNLGEGEVGGFFFVLVDSEGVVKSHYLADTPPWAYNGPTDIRCTHKCTVTGKKFRKTLKNRTLEQLMDGMQAKYEMQEITDEIKNKDMCLIPHPFGGDMDGLTPVLLDPMDDKIRRLVDLQNSGGADEIVKAISEGKFLVDNTLLKRKGPQGVAIHKMKYKFERKF